MQLQVSLSLADSFASFVTDKISNLHLSLSSNPITYLHTYSSTSLVLQSVKIHGTQSSVHAMRRQNFYETQPWKFTERNSLFTIRSVKLWLYRADGDTWCTKTVTANKSNLTDPNRNTNPNWHSNGNIFMHISLTPIKRLYCNNKRNFCGGAVAGFVDGPVFSVFWLFTHLLTRIR